MARTAVGLFVLNLLRACAEPSPVETLEALASSYLRGYFKPKLDIEDYCESGFACGLSLMYSYSRTRPRARVTWNRFRDNCDDRWCIVKVPVT